MAADARQEEQLSVTYCPARSGLPDSCLWPERSHLEGPIWAAGQQSRDSCLPSLAWGLERSPTGGDVCFWHPLGWSGLKGRHLPTSLGQLSPKRKAMLAALSGAPSLGMSKANGTTAGALALPGQ